jgi:hypothetical protein
VINLSPAKLAITALAAGAMLIIQNWDDVAPVIKRHGLKWIRLPRHLAAGKLFWAVLACI